MAKTTVPFNFVHKTYRTRLHCIIILRALLYSEHAQIIVFVRMINFINTHTHTHTPISQVVVREHYKCVESKKQRSRLIESEVGMSVRRWALYIIIIYYYICDCDFTGFFFWRQQREHSRKQICPCETCGHSHFPFFFV